MQLVELITADQRDIRVNEFIDAMRDEIQPLPGLERLTVRAPEGGPPGRELDIRLLGDDLEQLKAASQEIIFIAAAIPGTSDIEDNLDYGAEERIIRVSQKGRSLGFTAQYFCSAYTHELQQVVDDFEMSLEATQQEVEDLSLPLQWIPRGLKQSSDASHRWWFQVLNPACLLDNSRSC